MFDSEISKNGGDYLQIVSVKVSGMSGNDHLQPASAPGASGSWLALSPHRLPPGFHR